MRIYSRLAEPYAEDVYKKEKQRENTTGRVHT